MADTTKPYGYIEAEIKRLEREERTKRSEAENFVQIADILCVNKMALEKALENQKKFDTKDCATRAVQTRESEK